MGEVHRGELDPRAASAMERSRAQCLRCSPRASWRNGSEDWKARRDSDDRFRVRMVLENCAEAVG